MTKMPRDLLAGAVSTTVDTGVYPLDIVLRTCHRFTGEFYLHAQFVEDHVVEVTFLEKDGDRTSDEIPGRFLNELLDQSLRARVAEETHEVRNLILAHALSETCLFRAELEEADPREDPLGIVSPERSK